MRLVWPENRKLSWHSGFKCLVWVESRLAKYYTDLTSLECHSVYNLHYCIAFVSSLQKFIFITRIKRCEHEFLCAIQEREYSGEHTLDQSLVVIKVQTPNKWGMSRAPKLGKSSKSLLDSLLLSTSALALVSTLCPAQMRPVTMVCTNLCLDDDALLESSSKILAKRMVFLMLLCLERGEWGSGFCWAKCVHGYAPNGVCGLDKVGISADTFASLPYTSYPAPGQSDKGLNFLGVIWKYNGVVKLLNQIYRRLNRKGQARTTERVKLLNQMYRRFGWKGQAQTTERV